MSNIRFMTEADLNSVLSWRNHDSVRKFMFETEIISFETHRDWYFRMSKRDDVHLLIYEEDGVSAGFLRVDKDSKNLIAEWGFYSCPDSAKGTGAKMGEAALNFIFMKLGYRKVVGRVIDFNYKSKKLHERLGFSLEGELREQYYDGSNYHQVSLYGLLNREWLSK